MITLTFIVFLLLCIINLQFFIFGSKERIVFIIASLSKIIIAFIGTYVALPFTGIDTVNFENFAFNLFQNNSAWEIIQEIEISKSFVISSITALFYHLLIHDTAIPIFINCFLGILIHFNSLRLFDTIWKGGQKGRLLFFTLIGFAPMLTLFSAVFLRENYIILFLLLATIHLVKFSISLKINSAILFVVYTLLASFFHGALILYILALPLYVLLNQNLLSFQKKIFLMTIFISSLISVFYFFEFQKLNILNNNDFSDFLEILNHKTQTSANANTSYLQNLQAQTFLDLVWQIPVRVFYFLTKPFIWDIKTPSYMVLFLDAIFWLYCLIIIIKQRKILLSRPETLAILIATSILIVVFAYGTTNFGTAIRHRSKFLIEISAILSPYMLIYLRRFSVK